MSDPVTKGDPLFPSMVCRFADACGEQATADVLGISLASVRQYRQHERERLRIYLQRKIAVTPDSPNWMRRLHNARAIGRPWLKVKPR